jgi:hypothetical protein
MLKTFWNGDGSPVVMLAVIAVLMVLVLAIYPPKGSTKQAAVVTPVAVSTPRPTAIADSAPEPVAVVTAPTIAPIPTEAPAVVEVATPEPVAAVEVTAAPEPIADEPPAVVDEPAAVEALAPEAAAPAPVVQVDQSAAVQADEPAAQSGDSAPCAVGQYKANRNSHIFHAPGQLAYARTNANVACFDTAVEAIAAGYRAAKR